MIKVSGVTSLHEARYCAGMGVDMVGFPLDSQQEGHMSAQTFEEIAGWLAGVQYVGELGPLANTDLTAYELDFLETDSTDVLNELQRYNIPCILRCQFESFHDQGQLLAFLNLYADQVAYFLIEAEGGLADNYFSILKSITTQFPILIGFGITASNVNRVIDEIKPKGLALKGSQEIKTGLNDFDQLGDILEAIDTDDYV